MKLAIESLLEMKGAVTFNFIAVAISIDEILSPEKVKNASAGSQYVEARENGDIYFMGVKLKDPLNVNEWNDIEFNDIISSLSKCGSAFYEYRNINIHMDLSEDRKTITYTVHDGLASRYEFTRTYHYNEKSFTPEKLSWDIKMFYTSIMRVDDGLNFKEFRKLYSEAMVDYLEVYDADDKFTIGKLTAWISSGKNHIKFYAKPEEIHILPLKQKKGLDASYEDTMAYNLLKSNLSIGRSLYRAGLKSNETIIKKAYGIEVNL